jgi:DNA-binding beta-propeller fold protein YncE
MMDAYGDLVVAGRTRLDPRSGKVERVDLGGSPHWIAISHATGKLFASFKTKGVVAVVDTQDRRMTNVISIPHNAEGLAVAPDGEVLFVCAQQGRGACDRHAHACIKANDGD